jgi:hypothetical protein
MSGLSPDLLAAIESVTAKRARTVIDHILKHGFITTEDLKTKYGYNHPPRAARDVREEGIPLETFSVEGSDGRTIAAYRFGDPTKIENNKLGGRQIFAKKLKASLYARQLGRCGICGQAYEIRYLQIDHRVPYEVAGEAASPMTDEGGFLMICGSCQRSKSWSCEHCKNWQELKDPGTCHACYWASPEEYAHVAQQAVKREVVVWSGEEIKSYEVARGRAQALNLTLAEYLKRLAAK